MAVCLLILADKPGTYASRIAKTMRALARFRPAPLSHTRVSRVSVSLSIGFSFNVSSFGRFSFAMSRLLSRV